MTATLAPPTLFRAPIIRRAGVGDIEAVMRLAETMPTLAQWPAAAYNAYCIEEHQSSDMQAKVLFVACAKPTRECIVIGFAALSAVMNPDAGECELENMAVAEEWRRQGIGRRLLAAGSLWCRTWSSAAPPGSGLWLEVRASNRSAIAFYEGAGFIVTGQRPAYYAHPVEDAILMRKVFVSRSAAC